MIKQNLKAFFMMITIAMLALIFAQTAVMTRTAAAASYDQPLSADLFDLSEAERTAHLALAECEPREEPVDLPAHHDPFRRYRIVRMPNPAVDLTQNHEEVRRMCELAYILMTNEDECDVLSVRYLAEVLAAFWPGKKEQPLDGFTPSDTREIYRSLQGVVRKGLTEANVRRQKFVNCARSLAREMVYNESTTWVVRGWIAWLNTRIKR